MDELFLRRLVKWHDNDQFQQIIEAIEALPHETIDYDLQGQLARAYNNRAKEGDYEKAAELLNLVADQGRDDPIWHYRLGYSYYYRDLEELASIEFLRTLELDPADDDARLLLNSCREILQKKAGREQDDYSPEIYTEDEREILEEHIADYFGEYPSVFHEIISPDIHVDICVIPPTAERDYYVLITMGMGAHRMNVPDELKECKLSRTELLICLPSDWNVQSEKEIWYWPIRSLKQLARLPGDGDTWLGWGHTVDNQTPFAENTRLCASMLISVCGFGDDASVCYLPEGEEVNFYQVIPLYREELEYKMKYDSESLLNRMDSRVLLIDPARKNFCDGDDIMPLRVLPQKKSADKNQIPVHLENYAENIFEGDFLEFDLRDPAGNQQFEIFYYGDLLPIEGDPVPYITGTDFSESLIIAKEIKSGEEILLFDGTRHGYNAMFCDEYTQEQRNNRPLTKLDAPPSEIHIVIGQGIDYEDEKEDYDVNDQEQVSLMDGSMVSWEQVKRDGFDYIALFFVDENGELIPFMDEELA